MGRWVGGTPLGHRAGRVCQASAAQAFLLEGAALAWQLELRQQQRQHDECTARRGDAQFFQTDQSVKDCKKMGKKQANECDRYLGFVIV